MSYSIGLCVVDCDLGTLTVVKLVVCLSVGPFPPVTCPVPVCPNTSPCLTCASQTPSVRIITPTPLVTKGVLLHQQNRLVEEPDRPSTLVIRLLVHPMSTLPLIDLPLEKERTPHTNNSRLFESTPETPGDSEFLQFRRGL